ncbi:MAG: hypothetical protein AAGA77_09270 [Bacteroidota bacterium]
MKKLESLKGLNLEVLKEENTMLIKGGQDTNTDDSDICDGGTTTGKVTYDWWGNSTSTGDWSDECCC